MTHRLFLAIDLPDDQKQLVSRLTSDLIAAGLPVNWEEPSHLHLTLNFLGRVDDTTATRLKAGLPRILAQTPPFNLRLSFLEPLYRRHEGSIVYLAPTGDLDILKSLHTSLAQFLIKLSLPQPLRFFPHILIGRLKKADPVFTKKVLDQIRDIDFIPLPPFAVSSVTLYESFITRAGAYHRKIGQYGLK